MTTIELLAVIFGFLCVALTIKQSIWCWPTGLVQVFLFIFIFSDAKLYSDLILHVIYVFMQIYGWHHWLHGGRDRAALPVTVQKTRARTAWAVVCVLGTIAWGCLMNRFTDASVPYADAFTTVTSLVAQWLMARKRLESWVFWIAVDIIAIGVYFHKQLYLTTGLYMAFLVMATIGFFAWRKALRAGVMTGGATT